MTNKAIKLLILFTAIINLYIIPAQAEDMIKKDLAVLGALNKITGKTSILKVNIGDTAKFGDLNIKVFSCYKASPLDAPESASFLQIDDKKDRVFSGWMFASSPALYAMEHAVYDIWVKSCENQEVANTQIETQ